MSTMRELTISEDSLRELAYAIWVEEGRPDGRAEAHWFEAVRRASTPPAKPKKPVVRKAPARKH
jgi:Protein of unknown function (DUF2934)